MRGRKNFRYIDDVHAAGHVPYKIVKYLSDHPHIAKILKFIAPSVIQKKFLLKL